MPAGVN